MGVYHAHLLERCILWVFPCTSILKMCTLGLSLHICLKDVYSGSFPEHVLKTCNLCVSLHTCLKDAYSGLFPCTFALKLCTLGVSLLISLKYVYSGSFPAHRSESCIHGVLRCTSIVKLCIWCIQHTHLNTNLKNLSTEYFPERCAL